MQQGLYTHEKHSLAAGADDEAAQCGDSARVDCEMHHHALAGQQYARLYLVVTLDAAMRGPVTSRLSQAA
jgi:hypothetical protein